MNLQDLAAKFLRVTGALLVLLGIVHLIATPHIPHSTSENNSGVVRLIANLPFCRRFLRPPSTEAPSLHRSYPASSVLRASPPSQSARPVSHELPVVTHKKYRSGGGPRISPRSFHHPPG